MNLRFELTTEIPAKAEAVYNAWLDSEEHALMTDSESALASHTVGAEHKAHGAYIWGKNIELVPHSKIVQSWRSNSFKETDSDSIIEVTFEDKGDVTKLTLIHSEVPEKEFEVETGWQDHYFTPMVQYFNSKKDQ